MRGIDRPACLDNTSKADWFLNMLDSCLEGFALSLRLSSTWRLNCTRAQKSIKLAPFSCLARCLPQRRLWANILARCVPACRTIHAESIIIRRSTRGFPVSESRIQTFGNAVRHLRHSPCPAMASPTVPRLWGGNKRSYSDSNLVNDNVTGEFNSP
jgi:hypothetical protein